MFKYDTRISIESKLPGSIDNWQLLIRCRIMKAALEHVWVDEGNTYQDIEDLPLAFYVKLNSKLGKEYNKYTTDKAKENGGKFHFKESYTDLLKEALKRGFVHSLDFVADAKYAHIRITKFGLIWPENFESQMKALVVQNKIGIPLITGVSTPLTK